MSTRIPEIPDRLCQAMLSLMQGQSSAGVQEAEDDCAYKCSTHVAGSVSAA
jgi:hypothetical protein